jgi:hypothetical protein
LPEPHAFEHINNNAKPNVEKLGKAARAVQGPPSVRENVNLLSQIEEIEGNGGGFSKIKQQLQAQIAEESRSASSSTTCTTTSTTPQKALAKFNSELPQWRSKYEGEYSSSRRAPTSIR